jgi:hypothetical protein
MPDEAGLGIKQVLKAQRVEQVQLGFAKADRAILTGMIVLFSSGACLVEIDTTFMPCARDIPELIDPGLHLCVLQKEQCV